MSTDDTTENGADNIGVLVTPERMWAMISTHQGPLDVFMAWLVARDAVRDRMVAGKALNDAANQIRAENEAHAVEYGADDQRFRDGLSHCWAKLLRLRDAATGHPVSSVRGVNAANSVGDDT